MVLYFVIHLNCSGKAMEVIIPFHDFYCSVIRVLWPQMQLLRTLKSHCSHFKHEQPAGLSFALRTKPGQIAELVLSGCQWTLGPRNSRANLFQKTYSNFRRSLQPKLLSYPLSFCWVNITLILPLPPAEKVSCHGYTHTLHICSFKFHQVAKPSRFFSSIEVAKAIYVRQRRDWWEVGALEGTFWWILFSAFSTSHCSRKQPLRQRSPSHCCPGNTVTAPGHTKTCMEM